MCDDFFDDYDDFDGEDYTDESFEDPLDEDLEPLQEFEPEDQEDLSPESDPTETKQDEFTAKDAFILGGAMGWAFEEGYNEGRRKRYFERQQKKKGSDPNDPY